MKISRNRLAVVCCLFLFPCALIRAQTNIFEMPRLFPRHLQLAQAFRMQIQTKNYPAMEQICREGIKLLPDDPTWRYNLACSLARQGRQTDALDTLDQAIDLGFREANAILGDSDLATLRRLARFQTLLKKAGELRGRPVAGRPIAAPAEVTTKAMVTSSNTVWDFNIGMFQTYFTFPPATAPLGTGDYVRLPETVGLVLRDWQSDGSAAGNAGDLYDNRDGGHSTLKLSLFPQMRPVVYSDEARQSGVHLGLSPFGFNGTIVLGNASTALTGGPFWRSNARQAYVNGHSMLLLAMQYLRNQHYVFPQHRDYLPEAAGDTFPANTPYLTVTPGSSYSDQPILEAYAAALAAFQPAVKEALIREGLVFPALQMLLRASQKEVKAREDYLTPKAHPVVFDGARTDLLRMITMAQAMRTNALPPFAAIRMQEETPAIPGRDFCDVAIGESLFDSPAAIARIVRGMPYTRRIVVDGRASRNPMTSHLKPHWVLLQGDPEKVRLTPRLGEPMVAEIEVDYHGGSFPVATSAKRSSRVDIALIVENGEHYSPPAYVSLYYLNNEIRSYGADGRILAVDYLNATNNYTDPHISLPRKWIDRYTYDKEGHPTGWTRHRGEATESFTADGARVLTRDRLERPLTACRVGYTRRDSVDPAGQPLFEVVETDTDRVLTYVYANDSDMVGEVSGEHRSQ